MVCAIYRFSQNSQYLAVGYNEGCVDFYNLTKLPNLDRTGYCKGISQFVMWLDFSSDDKYLRVNCLFSTFMYTHTNSHTHTHAHQHMHTPLEHAHIHIFTSISLCLSLSFTLIVAVVFTFCI